MTKSLRSTIASDSTQPHDVLQVLRSGQHRAVQAFRMVLPYATRHPSLYEMFDENAPDAGILLRLYDIVHNHTRPDWQALSVMMLALEASLALESDPVPIREAIELIMEWTRGQVRHRDVLTSVITGIMDSIFPTLEKHILIDNDEMRLLYKRLYKIMLRRSGISTKDRILMLVRVYKSHYWVDVIGEMTASCLKSDRVLLSNANARQTFFVYIADAMNGIHSNLRKLMVTGDQLAVYKRILKMVMQLLSQKRRSRTEQIQLERLRLILEWSFYAVPVEQRPVIDKTTDAIIHQRNREFQSGMRTTLSGIRRQLRARIGVPTNLPVFSQLRNMTRKSIIRDPNAQQRIITMINNTQAQIQRHRFG